jgi:CheY-like chemotaxis protein
MALGSQQRPVEILLVEDNPGDVKLTKEIVKDSEYKTNFAVAEDGEEAMAYLRNKGKSADSPRPDVILLDLNLPTKQGAEVMADIYADEELAGIPIVILTGTEAEQSLLESYDIPANRHLTKPITLARFDSIIRLMNLVGGMPGRMPIPETLRKVSTLTERKESKRSWWPFGG